MCGQRNGCVSNRNGRACPLPPRTPAPPSHRSPARGRQRRRARRFARELAAHLVADSCTQRPKMRIRDARNRRARRCSLTAARPAYWRLVTPSSVTITTRPATHRADTRRAAGRRHRTPGKHDGVRPVGVLDAAHRERAETARIAGGEDAVARHHHDRKSAFDLRERIGNASTSVCRSEWAMSCTIISESEVVWK